MNRKEEQHARIVASLNPRIEVHTEKVGTNFNAALTRNARKKRRIAVTAPSGGFVE